MRYFARQAYQWDDNKSVVSWICSQMNENGIVDAESFIGRNISALQKDAFFSSMKSSVVVSIH